MKGLFTIPSQNDLSKAYSVLIGPPQSMDTEKIVIFSQWVRFDPRLGEILIDWIVQNWKKVSVWELSQNLKQSSWPQALGVLLEQVPLHLKFNKKDLRFFLSWKATVMTDVAKADDGLFFIGLRKFGGREAFQDAALSLRSYTKWGYLGREIMVNKFQNATRSQLDQNKRRELLVELSETHSQISVTDYIFKCSGLISRRQAQLDLAKATFLKPRGHTRGRIYISK